MRPAPRVRLRIGGEGLPPVLEAPGAVLDRLARHGPQALVGAVALGIAVPPLADAAHPLMGLACILFTMGAFLKADATAFQRELRHPLRLACMLAWASIGAPLLAIGSLRLLGAGENPAIAGLLIGTVAPPAGASIAVAAMLGLAPALALVGVVAATLAAPLTLPLLAGWSGAPGVALDAGALFAQSATIIGLAAIGAHLLHRFAAGPLQRRPGAASGLTVLGLMLAALGAMQDVQEHLRRDPGLVFMVLGAAFALNLGLQLAGAMLFAACGRGVALTAGLLGGNRSFALAWAAAGAGLPAPTELALALCAIPLFVLPALYRRLGPLATSLGEALLRRRAAAD